GARLGFARLAAGNGHAWVRDPHPVRFPVRKGTLHSDVPESDFGSRGRKADTAANTRPFELSCPAARSVARPWHRPCETTPRERPHGVVPFPDPTRRFHSCRAVLGSHACRSPFRSLSPHAAEVAAAASTPRPPRRRRPSWSRRERGPSTSRGPRLTARR